MNSKIIEFYSDLNVLITGGTGFFGKILIQKLLRCCCNMGSVYLIIRPKKGKSPKDRKEELFNDVVFDKMKKEVPNFLDKIVVLEGDASKIGLGLSLDDQNLIKKQINVVFHCAASVNMGANLKDTVMTNIRGLHELVNLCLEINNLKSFLFVSTAYSYSIYHLIEEKSYEPPIEAKTLIEFVEGAPEEILEKIKRRLIGKWPNVYAFSKAVAEGMFYKEAKNLPIGLFRPSMVMPAYEDPLPGWTSNVYGPVGGMLAAGLGLYRVFLGNVNLKLDVVPVDYCVNSLICAAWDVYNQRKNDSNEINLKQQLSVYNYASGKDLAIIWDHFLKYGLEIKIPLKKALWPTIMYTTNNVYIYRLLWFILHTIPGYAIDLYLILSQKKPRMIKIYKKIYAFTDALSYYTRREWDFVNQNVKNLWCKLGETDQSIFPFNVEIVDHKTFIYNVVLGIKLYILKEGIDNLENEMKHHRRLVLLRKVIKCGFQIILFIVVCLIFAHYI